MDSEKCAEKLPVLDQGILKNVKVFYRTEIVSRVVDSINVGESYESTILDAMNIADESWRIVSQKTIRNRFLSWGFQNSSMIKTAVGNNQTNLSMLGWNRRSNLF